MNIFNLNKYLSLDRYSHLTIDEERIKLFFESVKDYRGPESTEKIIGPVWINVFGKFGTNVFELIQNRSFSELAKSYEEYYINGISDGACAGKGLESYRKKIEYSRRNFSRLKNLAKHLELQHDSNDNFEKDDFILLDKITDSFVSNERIYEGRPWSWEVKGKKIHAELLDHIYFADIILKFSRIYDWNEYTFLGDGSGILSSIVMSNRQDGSYNFIDLAHFLLKQHLSNFEENKTSFHLAENFQVDGFPKSDVLINQDSFPEINEEGLRNYFELIKKDKIKFVASYNQERYIESHSNYRKFLFECGMESLVRFESTMRENYFIEIFKKT